MTAVVAAHNQNHRLTQWTPAMILAAAAELEENAIRDQTYRELPVGGPVGGYIDRLRFLDYSARTLERERLLARLAMWCASRGMTLNDLTTALLEDFLVWVEREALINRGIELTARTKENYTSTLRVFTAWLYDNDYIQRDPGRRLKGPRAKGTSRRSHTPATIRRLVNAQDSRMTKLALQILYYAGLRRNELCNLQWADIDLDANVIVVTHAKGGTPNEVPSIHAALRRHLVRYVEDFKPRPTDYVLHKQRRFRHGTWPLYTYEFMDKPGAKLSLSGVDKWWQLACERAGLPLFPMHELRHSIGTHMQEAGHDLYATKELLRHVSIATTERVYLHLEKRASVARVQGLMGDPLEDE